MPNSSPISASGMMFFNTLFDENASCHLAVGRAYSKCLQGGPDMAPEDFAAAGGNDSLAHVDFMIGSAELDVDGLEADGTAQPLLRGTRYPATAATCRNRDYTSLLDGAAATGCTSLGPANPRHSMSNAGR